MAGYEPVGRQIMCEVCHKFLQTSIDYCKLVSTMRMYIEPCHFLTNLTINMHVEKHCVKSNRQSVALHCLQNVHVYSYYRCPISGVQEQLTLPSLPVVHHLLVQCWMVERRCGTVRLHTGADGTSAGAHTDHSIPTLCTLPGPLSHHRHKSQPGED